MTQHSRGLQTGEIERLQQERPFLYLQLPADVRAQSVELVATHGRIYNPLRRYGISTIDQLLDYSLDELSALEGFGRRMTNAIQAGLFHYGWYLSPPNRVSIQPPPGDRWIELPRVTRLYSRLGCVPVKQLSEATRPVDDWYRLYWHLQDDCGIATIGELIAFSGPRLCQRLEEVQAASAQARREWPHPPAGTVDLVHLDLSRFKLKLARA